jgi:hypothetical protein
MFVGLAEGDRTICMQHQRPQAFAEEHRIRAVFRNVEKRFVEFEGSLVEATKFEVLHWAVGRVENLTWSHEVEFSAFHFKVLSILLKEQGFEGRGLITILRSLIHGSPFPSSPSSWLAGE